MINERIGSEMLEEFSGCDNDRPGSKENRAIWIFGIEPGDSVADKVKRSQTEAVHADPTYSIDQQLKWQFNQKSFKLLAAIEGCEVSAFREFARARQPFVKGSEGYFKGNIYPYACNNVGEWSKETEDEVGCSKQEYRNWCDAHRVPAVFEWVKKYSPRLFIGVGISLRNVFSRAAFGREIDLTPVQVQGKSQAKTIYCHTEDDRRLVVIPHFSGPYGLNCNRSIQEVGRFAASMLL